MPVYYIERSIGRGVSRNVIGHVFVPVYYIERSIGRYVSRTSEEKPSYLD